MTPPLGLRFHWLFLFSREWRAVCVPEKGTKTILFDRTSAIFEKLSLGQIVTGRVAVSPPNAIVVEPYLLRNL